MNSLLGVGWLLVLVLVRCSWGNSSCPASSLCTPWRDCPSYVEFRNLKQTDRDEYNRRLPQIKKSVCNRKPNKVCCHNEPSVDSSSPSWVPSLAAGECGHDHHTAFIVGGENTVNGEMPWAVLLGNNETKINWYCGGSLINAWYVVTAAHCKVPTVVRVGEWRVVDDNKPDPNNGLVFSQKQVDNCRRRNRPCQSFSLVDSSRDCVDGSGQFVFSSQSSEADCGPKHQDFTVSHHVEHPDYGRLRSGVVINDIALIKLDRPVRLSPDGQSNVSPICLPVPGTVDNSAPHLGEFGSEFGTVVGWGKTYQDDRQVAKSVNSAIQKKLRMPLVNNTQCGNILSTIFNFNLRPDIRSEYHLCGGAVAHQDTCNGDSGGPLIYRNNGNSAWWLAGTVSFGTKICGVGAPAVFTRITSYVDWITNNLT